MPIAMPLLVSIPDEKLYPLVGAVVPAWILLMLAPRWRWTKRTALLSLLIVSALQLALVSTPIRKMGVVGLMERMLTYQVHMPFEDSYRMHSSIPSH